MKKPKINKTMPEHSAEVWDLSNENLISTHDTLCEAVGSTETAPEERIIYYLEDQTWLRWIGPRPQNPPGR